MAKARYRNKLTKRSRYQAIANGLKKDRTSFESHWRDIADFNVPRRMRVNPNDRNKGDKRNSNIINSTGRYSSRTLGSGLHAGLTSPARPWLKLTTPNQELAERPNVKKFLKDVTDRMLTIFGVSNLYNHLPVVYQDLGTFGTAAMAVYEDEDDLFRCESFPIGSYWLGMDAKGRVCVFMTESEMSVRQIVEEYGVQEDGTTIDWSSISSQVKTLWEADQFEQAIQVTWIVQPNEEYDPNALEAKYLQFASCHFETGNQEKGFLRESGFKTFPVMAPRWDITGKDTYGTDCPGMTTLGDVRQLQVMERKKGQAIAKMIDPPVTGPANLRSQKVSLLPGDITYSDAREGSQGLRSIHEVTLNIEHLGRDIQIVEFRIKRGWYEDLFLMLGSSDPYRGEQPITAREVDERHEEKLIALGPTLQRTDQELLDPLVDRVFQMMAENNLLPEIPPELEGVKIKAEYISILSQAQKLIGVVGQDRFFQSLVPMIEVFPEIREKIDIYQGVDNYGEMLGVDPRLIIATDVARQAMQRNQQAAQQQAESEQALNVAKATQAASQARLASGDSALDRLTQAAGASA